MKIRTKATESSGNSKTRIPAYDKNEHLVLQALQFESSYRELFKKFEINYGNLSGEDSEQCRGLLGLNYEHGIPKTVSRLRKMGLVTRTNPGAPKSDGYKHLITEDGLVVLEAWNEAFINLGKPLLA